ncbi:alpha/beta hydrolase-fold protein [Nostocoides sp.]|uniref:alpha/beta hydrolase-fold protein n=1 Tax=Nostocoides sp. TaxID=1917966 RepID=UPI003BB0C541
MRKLAINQLRDNPALSPEVVTQFVDKHRSPIIEGQRATFLFRGSADELFVRHRVVGLPDPLPMKQLPGTDLWAATCDLPAGSRVEYQLETRRGEHYERFNDPLNPRVANSPLGSSSVCAGEGYHIPRWTRPDHEARAGELSEHHIRSKALRRDQRYLIYTPARFNTVLRYPLLVVHDGPEYVQFAAMRTVLDNLIHNLDIAPMVVAFVPPGDRLREYANFAPHARFLARELVPAIEERYPLVETSGSRCLMGSSFGGVAAVSTAYRYPGVFGSLLIQSASLVFTDIGQGHGGGPVFDPVVKFVNKYRAKPTRLCDRMYMSCGIYEPLITPNRSMVSVFREAGITVKYEENRDGHNWDNWRDRLQSGLSWLFPGPQKYVYE